MLERMPYKKTRYYGWLVWLLAALFYYYEYLLRITPNTMHEQLSHYYHLNAAAFGNLSAFYYYAYTPLQIPVGVLFDRYSPRLLLSINCFICVLGVSLFAISTELWMAQLGRFLLGIGSAFAFVGILKLATIWLPAKRFALVAGLTTSLGMLGAMVGENALTFGVVHLGWRETLWGLAALGVILTLCIWCFVRDGCVDTARQYRQRFTTTTFKSLFVGMGLLLLRPQIWLCAIIGGVLYTSLSVFAELWGKPYLEDVAHLSPKYAAFVISMVFLGWALGSPLQGFISDRFNSRRMPMMVSCLLAAVCFLLVLDYPHMAIALLCFLLFLFGIFSSAETIVFAVAKETSERQLAGSALALTNMFVMLVGTVLQPTVGKVIDYFSGIAKTTHQTMALHHYTGSEYQAALMIIPLAYLFAALLGLFLNVIPRKISPRAKSSVRMATPN